MKLYPGTFLSLTSALFVSCGKETVPPPESSMPKQPSGQATEIAGPESHWSKEVVDFPGFPLGPGLRVWSHFEISQRHKTLVMKDLPSYVTQLRGAGAAKEWEGTSAAWYFRLPPERIADFENYLVELGVPRDALYEERHIMEQPPGTPEIGTHSDRLIYGASEKSSGEGDIMGVQFGKSLKTVSYYLVNTNITRATIRILVAWKSGDVQILENPVKSAWE